MGNTSSTRFQDNPPLDRFNRLFSWIIGILLLVVVLVYAGERGYHAYHHTLKTLQSTFVEQSSVLYPAFAICPLENVPIVAVECLKETNQVEGASCLNLVTTIVVTWEGLTLSCLDFNNPGSVSQIESSSSIADELVMGVYENSSFVKDDIGALLIIHAQGETPEVEHDSSFLIDVGKVTEIWLTKEIYTYVDGSTEVEWTAVSSSATAKLAPSLLSSTLDIDAVLIYQGYFDVREYYVYTRNNWIGEVGGFAALMLFLHGAFTYLVMLVVSRFAYKNTSGGSGSKYQDKTSEL